MGGSTNSETSATYTQNAHLVNNVVSQLKSSYNKEEEVINEVINLVKIGNITIGGFGNTVSITNKQEAKLQLDMKSMTVLKEAFEMTMSNELLMDVMSSLAEAYNNEGGRARTETTTNTAFTTEIENFINTAVDISKIISNITENVINNTVEIGDIDVDGAANNLIIENKLQADAIICKTDILINQMAQTIDQENAAEIIAEIDAAIESSMKGLTAYLSESFNNLVNNLGDAVEKAIDGVEDLLGGNMFKVIALAVIAGVISAIIAGIVKLAGKKTQEEEIAEINAKRQNEQAMIDAETEIKINEDRNNQLQQLLSDTD